MSDIKNSYGDVQDDSAIPEPSDAIVKLYKEHIPDYLTEFEAAVAAQDQQAVLSQCHKMCSALKTMGFNNIADLLEAIQREKPTGETLVEVCRRVKTLIQHTLVLLNK